MPNLYNVPLENGVQLTLQNALLTGVTTLMTFTASVTSKLQASSTIPGTLVIDRVDANGNLTPTKTEYISFTGVSGSTVTGLTRGLANSTNQDHSAGAIVEFVPDVIWADAINDTFIVGHNADGTHKALMSLGSASINYSKLQNVTLDGVSSYNTSLFAPSLASAFLSGRTYIQAFSRSRNFVSLATSTYSISIQNANMHELYLNGSSKSLSVNDVFADTSMTSPFLVKVIYGGTCSLTFQNTINWQFGTAPVQTSTASRADYFGFIPSTASVFDGFVVGQSLTL